jgi:hypothetical protein
MKIHHCNKQNCDTIKIRKNIAADKPDWYFCVKGYKSYSHCLIYFCPYCGQNLK